MNNRISERFVENKKLLTIYFTAGFPKLNDTVDVIESLEKAGVDMIEIGLPFSDPIADGVVIQESSKTALENGMSTHLLFEQLKDIRKNVKIPLLIMGYFNPILQYGVVEFCEKCSQIGIDGLIIPDLPLEEFKKDYKSIFDEFNLINVFLIDPQTSEKRIREIDALSNGFIYVVSSSGTTGKTHRFGTAQNEFFKRLYEMNLKNPMIVGFGISDKKSFDLAVEFTSGGIIGSAFVKNLKENGTQSIAEFVGRIKN